MLQRKRFTLRIRFEKDALDVIEIEYSNNWGLHYNRMKYFNVSGGNFIPYQFGKSNDAMEFMNKFHSYKDVLNHNKKEQERFDNYKLGKRVNYTLKTE